MLDSRTACPNSMWHVMLINTISMCKFSIYKSLILPAFTQRTSTEKNIPDTRFTVTLKGKNWLIDSSYFYTLHTVTSGRLGTSLWENMYCFATIPYTHILWFLAWNARSSMGSDIILQNYFLQFFFFFFFWSECALCAIESNTEHTNPHPIFFSTSKQLFV